MECGVWSVKHRKMHENIYITRTCCDVTRAAEYELDCDVSVTIC